MTDTTTQDSVVNPNWLGEWRRLIDVADQSVYAAAAGQAAPALWLPLHAAAATVAFSRVHYTSAGFIGALIGDLCGHVTWAAAGSAPHRGTGRWRR